MRTTRKAAIIVAILGGLVAGGLAANLYALSNLQFRSYGEVDGMDNIDFMDLSVDIQMEVCNPTFIPAYFDKLDVDVIYKTTKLATLVIWGEMLPPETSVVLDGRASLDGSGIVGLLLGAFASIFSDKEEAFDLDEVVLVSTLDAPIMGVVPFSVSQEFDLNEAADVFSGIKSDSWDCA